MTGEPRALWFHCFSGIAGDMAMGSLVDVGADLTEIVALCERLPVGGWGLTAEPVVRCGIGATSVTVEIEESGVIRTAAHITGLIEEARLPDRVRSRALATFDALAKAEGKIHNRPPEKVHFHEVGGIDAIIDVVGTCAALEVLEIDQLYASPVAQGIGMIRSAHGALPNPPPAVVELLRGAPTYGTEETLELTTPTGAALLAANVSGWGPMPPMRIEASGFGAGDRDIDGRPNVTQAVIGLLEQNLATGQPVMLLETNVDDVTGEVLADALQALLDAGAFDAWLTPIHMKKGRPAYTLSALCDVALGAQVSAMITSTTGSLGVRGQRLDRWPRAREFDEVEVAGRSVRVKVSTGRVKVEHDDAERAARQTGLPVREVISLAEEAWRRRGEHHPSRGGDFPDPDDPRLA